jgi:leucyl-tRNA synthetase
MDLHFAEIEKKWNKRWKDNELYKTAEDPDKPKYYVLDMFPYPSGSGLHVGHPLGYVASDIVSRYKRLSGFNVLHPMGFDAFGLPAEQYAIETGTHPAITTEKNINSFREQLMRMGFSYDWSREVKTSDPKFYKWTQWIFLQLFKCWYNPFKNKAEYIEELIAILNTEGSAKLYEKELCNADVSAAEWQAWNEEQKQKFLMQFRLAYLDYADVWWCEALGTVLANDEVKDGVSERGGHPVEKIKMRQWFLRITAYAERLLEGLNTVDFSESMKEMQRNWIGRSEGALVKFSAELNQQEQAHTHQHETTIEIFTTRPDTIFGATFIVLAPEHELVSIVTTSEYKNEVENYISYVNSRSERDRISEVKKVTGQFTGSYALHPFTGKKLPVYIAEYVLAGYGTGAIMAVPSNDDRDYAFAEKFGLEIRPVIDQSKYPGAAREDKVGLLINSDMLNGLEVKDAIKKIVQEIESRNIGRAKINYRFRDAGFSRQRYWGEPFPVYYKNDIPYVLDASELPVQLPDVEDFKPVGAGKSPLAGVTTWVNMPDGTTRETDTMPGYAGSSWYFYRYMDVNNENAFAAKQKIDYWQDVDLYIGGSEHAVGHLLYSRMWNKFLFDLGFVPKDEPYKKLVNQGMIHGYAPKVRVLQLDDNRIIHPSFDNIDFKNNTVKTGDRIHPIAKLSGAKRAMLEWTEFSSSEMRLYKKRMFKDGQETITYPLVYHADTFDWKLDDNGDAYIVVEYESEKMSKSRWNVINPDQVIDEYGADCFRLYMMFLGPLDASKPWDNKGITGVQGFLRKLWRLFVDESGNMKVTNVSPTPDELKILHKTIKKTSEDIEKLSFNTAVAQFMICVNELTAIKCSKKAILSELLITLSSFAPFITEELWEALGNASSIHTAAWPLFKEDYLVENTFTYPVSVNGKTRATIELPLDMPNHEIENAVLALESVLKWTDGKAPKKVIIVKGKIVNLVV